MDPVDDDRNYKNGLYYNPDDERVVVPKRNRLFGYTFNLARKEVTPVLVLWMLIALILFTLFVIIF
jgi:uncharacterized membrane protein